MEEEEGVGKWGGQEMCTWRSNLANLSGEGEDAKQRKIKGFYSMQPGVGQWLRFQRCDKP